MKREIRNPKLLLVLAACVCAVAVILLLDPGSSLRAGTADPAPVELDQPDRKEPLETTANGVEHVEKKSPSREGVVPPAFVGDVSIVGEIVFPDNRPAAGARIVCRPKGYLPLGAPERLHLTTQADDRGLFRMDGLPSAGAYELGGISDFGTTRRTFGRHATMRSIRLVLQKTYYARYEFYDTAGRPIRVQGTFMPVADGMLLSSTGTFPTHEMNRVIRQSLPVHDDPGNVVTVFYRGRLQVTAAGRAPLVRVPGYRPVALPFVRRDMAEWPRADRIELEAEEKAAVLVRVRFPELRLPSGWNATQGSFDLQLTLKAGDLVVPVRRRLNLVRLPGPDFALRLDGFGALEFDVQGDMESREVVPRYPAFAFLVLDYAEVLPKGVESHHVVVEKMNGEGKATVLMEWPGRGRVGPIPVGEYRLLLFLSSMEGIGEPHRRVEGVRLREGLNEIRWR